MKRFLDTSALYAVLDRDDAFHEAARAQWQEILSSTDLLVTSNYVVVEACALIQRRLGMDALRAFHDEVLPAIQIQWVNSEDHENAMRAVLAADRRHLSLVDCASFQVMRSLGLRSVFAFDQHFQEQGFETLPG